jgi:hypothetical protein
MEETSRVSQERPRWAGAGRQEGHPAPVFREKVEAYVSFQTPECRPVRDKFLLLEAFGAVAIITVVIGMGKAPPLIQTQVVWCSIVCLSHSVPLRVA